MCVCVCVRVCVCVCVYEFCADGKSDPAAGGGAAVLFYQHFQRPRLARAHHLQGTHSQKSLDSDGVLDNLVAR